MGRVRAHALGAADPGPRIELRRRLGHLAWGGLALALGYQPNLSINRHVGDLSVGFEAPWMWW